MLNFREVLEQDFLSIMALANSCDPVPLERDSIYHLFTRHFSDTCFVAEEEEKIVGYLLGFISQTSPSIGYIHNVCVAPHWRRKNIAETLYQNFKSKVEKRGCDQIFLIVNPSNEHSIIFHKKLGFQESLEGTIIKVGNVKAIKDYNGPDKHMVLFWKKI